MTEMTRCFECEATVPVDEFEDHACPTERYDDDPYEPWIDGDLHWEDEDDD